MFLILYIKKKRVVVQIVKVCFVVQNKVFTNNELKTIKNKFQLIVRSLLRNIINTTLPTELNFRFI